MSIKPRLSFEIFTLAIPTLSRSWTSPTSIWQTSHRASSLEGAPVKQINTVKPALGGHPGSGHSKRRPKIGFQDWLSLNAGQKYCRMLQDWDWVTAFLVVLNCLHAEKFCMLCFWKIVFFLGIRSECPTVWIQIRHDILEGLFWVQTTCKSFIADDS